MATITLTPNLKLRVSSDLTEDAKFNLNKIDELASTFRVNTNGQAVIRSIGDILFEPNSPDAGGSGVGGNVQIGSVDQPAGEFNVNANASSLSTSINSEDAISTQISFDLLKNSQTLSLKAPDSLASTFSLTLPGNVGQANQVLTSNGDGVTFWADVQGVNLGQELAIDWLAGDGATKTINHNLGTRNIIVQIIDTDNDYRTIEIDETLRPNDNAIVLNSSMAPTTRWIVLLKQIGN